MADSGMLFQVARAWTSGGWLMLPLFVLAVFVYYTAFELWIRLEAHFLVRKNVYQMSDREIAIHLDSNEVPIRRVLAGDARTVEEEGEGGTSVQPGPAKRKRWPVVAVADVRTATVWSAAESSMSCDAPAASSASAASIGRTRTARRVVVLEDMITC